MTDQNAGGWPDDAHATCVHCGGQNFVLSADLGAEIDRRVASIVAAREAAAWCAAIEAAVEAADGVNTSHCSEEEEDAANAAVGDAITAIRALTPPASYAAALEAVRREEREACANVAGLYSYPVPDDMSFEDPSDTGWNAACKVIAAAIRARGEEGGR